MSNQGFINTFMKILLVD